MDCANCAQTITRSLVKSGYRDVFVDFATGEVTFEQVGSEQVDTAVDVIQDLGYRVTARSDQGADTTDDAEHHGAETVRDLSRKFWICFCLTLPLFLHMVLPFHWLHLPWVQFALATPVLLIGWIHFGRSAWKSVQAGFPNMDVLITLGASSAYFYSLAGLIRFHATESAASYLFFETAATIITLIFLGNLIEHRSVARTTSAIRELSKLQPERARRVIRNEDETTTIELVPANVLAAGDELQVNEGDRVPVDGKLLSGEASLDESFLTGESLPVEKTVDDKVTGGAVVLQGNFRMIAEQVGSSTTLSKIIALVKYAQRDKPSIQRLGDRVSAIFVPAVVGISGLTFLISWLVLDIGLSKSVLHSVAVLVISCPCAMGLATPTAVMVGIGRAARNGILIKGGSTLETLAGIRTVVFDKTGTLTNGDFRIECLEVLEGTEAEVKEVLYALESRSAHPIGRALVRELEGTGFRADGRIRWKKIEEDKGIGMNGWTEAGDVYSVGSFRMVQHFHADLGHNVYVLKNDRLLATVDLADTIKAGARETLMQLKGRGIRVVMVSGDKEQACLRVAKELGIDEVHCEKHPREKQEIIAKLAAEASTAMVGDGINDAPALAKASVGISLSDATQVAIHSSQVILLRSQDLRNLLDALEVSRLTYRTIKQNLFWAFFYNVIAIPIAAAGYLSPMIGALSMAFSDVIVVGNSLRLRTRRIRRYADRIV
jgi:Cu+-exporting ATPase